MVTMGVFPFQGKTHMVEPGIEPGTSWLVVRSSDHQATRLVVQQLYNTLLTTVSYSTATCPSTTLLLCTLMLQKVSVCGRSLAGIVDSNPAGAWMSVYFVCYVSLQRAEH